MATPDRNKPAPGKIAVLGAGSWGSTLAKLLADSGRAVTLWSHDPQKASLLERRRRLNHPVRVDFPNNVKITGALGEALVEQELVLICCNSQSMRGLSAQIDMFATKRPSEKGDWQLPVLVSAAKGLELTTLYRMTEVINDVIGDLPVCTLSGPNLAGEILKGLPTASVIASASFQVAAYAQQRLSSSAFRVYTNSDVTGVELGGTLKNVIAIAAGISDGLELGANAKAALLTRGLAEMTRLACALGAEKTTLAGLAGMGDLFATCTSQLSRNYKVGLALAGGLSSEEAKRTVGATAEGIPTTHAVCELSKKLGIDLPIAEQVEATLKGQTTPKGAIMSLMSRPLASE
jgi:glycerol-3-phosphate dehydrogenase (NAD(P)+)